MTVAELIEALKAFPQDLPVYSDGAPARPRREKLIRDRYGYLDAWWDIDDPAFEVDDEGKAYWRNEWGDNQPFDAVVL